MFALVFLSVLSCACAAPQYYRRPPPPYHRHHHHHHDDFEMKPFMGDSVFDTANFWAELNNEMSKFDELMKTFMEHFPTSATSAGIEGNQYKINIALTGFEEKDIVVKARDGLVMVQASRQTEDGNARTYMDVRSLPAIVNAAGSWTYEQGVLKIVFPLKEGVTTEEPSVEVSTEVVTEAPKEREEVESEESHNTNQDADVGAERGDTELLTNEIPRQNSENGNTVEATTYAVDVKDEVEFVPVRY